MFLEEAVHNSHELSGIEDLIQDVKDSKTEKERLKHIRKVEDALAEYFNVAGVSINRISPAGLISHGISEALVGSGAFTVPFPITPFNIPKIIHRKDGGIQFAEKQKSFILINVSPSVYTHLSKSEILALILHEIGHNFFKGDIIRRIYNLVMFIPKIVFRILQSNPIFAKLEDQHKILGPIFSFVTEVQDFIYGLLRHDYARNAMHAYQEVSLLREVLKFIKKITYSIGFILKPLNDPIGGLVKGAVDVFFGAYSDEVFSDDFATTHGYGQPLITALKKLSDPDIATDSKFFPTYLKALADSFQHLSDPHPSFLKRMDSIEARARKDLTLIKDEKAKKYAKANLDQMIKSNEEIRKNLKSLKTQDFSDKIRYFIDTKKDVKNHSIESHIDESSLDSLILAFSKDTRLLNEDEINSLSELGKVVNSQKATLDEDSVYRLAKLRKNLSYLEESMSPETRGFYTSML